MNKVLLSLIFICISLYASDCEELKLENEKLKLELAKYKSSSDNQYVQKGEQIIDDVKTGAKWTLGKSSELVKDGLNNLNDYLNKDE